MHRGRSVSRVSAMQLVTHTALPSNCTLFFFLLCLFPLFSLHPLHCIARQTNRSEESNWPREISPRASKRKIYIRTIAHTEREKERERERERERRWHSLFLEVDFRIDVDRAKEQLARSIQDVWILRFLGRAPPTKFVFEARASFCRSTEPSGMKRAERASELAALFGYFQPRAEPALALLMRRVVVPPRCTRNTPCCSIFSSSSTVSSYPTSTNYEEIQQQTRFSDDLVEIFWKPSRQMHKLFLIRFSLWLSSGISCFWIQFYAHVCALAWLTSWHKRRMLFIVATFYIYEFHWAGAAISQSSRRRWRYLPDSRVSEKKFDWSVRGEFRQWSDDASSTKPPLPRSPPTESKLRYIDRACFCSTVGTRSRVSLQQWIK